MLSSLAPRVASVTFRARGGEWSHVTMACTVFEAARSALDWFHDPIWKGPRPTAETILMVQPSGSEKTCRVKAGRIGWTAERPRG